MVKLLKYIISGMVSMVALNYLIDLFGICVLIGYLSNVEYIRELAEMGVIDIDVALEKVSSISKELRGSVVSYTEKE